MLIKSANRRNLMIKIKKLNRNNNKIDRYKYINKNNR